jgi:gluconate:H+ symporter, GntP family
LPDVTKSYENGVGGVLGYVGVLIALGAMLANCSATSGGADKIVDTLLHGRPATLPWKMTLIAGIIGIPLFFEVGLVLLVPVVMLAVHRSKGPAMLLAIPALAGLSVLHDFIPPHPGPVAAIGILHADIGITLALGLLVAFPVVVVCGPLFSHLAARWVPIGAAGSGLAFVGAAAGNTALGTEAQPAGTGNGRQLEGTLKQATQPEEESQPAAPHQARDPEAKRSPSFGWTLATVWSPVVLLLLRAAADLWVDPRSALGKKIGASLLPIVGVLLIVGAGGSFKLVLVDGGTGTAIGKVAVAARLSALVLGWIVAVLIRVSTKSATVATVTAAGIVAPLTSGLPPAQLALVVLAIGAGSLFFSHVNDAGFWLVKEYFGMTLWENIKSWSVMETLISVMGLLLPLLLSHTPGGRTPLTCGNTVPEVGLEPGSSP